MKISSSAAVSTNLLGTNKTRQTILASRKGVLFAALIAIGSSSTLVQAQSINSNASVIRFVPPAPPSTPVIISGRRQGGASRGNCSVTDKPLTALVPAVRKSLKEKPGRNPALSSYESVWGLTTTSSPTFWFYLPYSFNLPLIFVLQDEQGNNLHKISLTNDQTQSGIIKVKLPEKIVKLEVNKKYRWFLVVDCEQDAPPEVQGWVQRVSVAPALKSQLHKATPQQLVQLYAVNGIWYDALTSLADLRSANPKDAKLFADWVSLLSSVGLEAFANEPINLCCNSKK